MKILFATTLVSVLVLSATAQPQSPFVIPPTAPPAAQPPAANPTPTTPTPAPGQGTVTDPAGDATAQPPLVGDTPASVFQGGTNAGGRSAFGLGATNTGPNLRTGQQVGAPTTTGSAPLFLNVAGTPISDATGQPVGTLQQLVLNPSGAVNLAVVSVGGRLVPVPWQLIATGTFAGRTGLIINSDRQLLQGAPAVAMGQLPLLTQDAVQQQILDHFAVQAANEEPVVVDTTAQGRAGGAGVTITGGATNTVGTATNTFGIPTNGPIPNRTTTNQAVNTTGGLLSPTGRTNATFDGFNSGPGSTDRFGPRQNANPTQTTNSTRR